VNQKKETGNRGMVYKLNPTRVDFVNDPCLKRDLAVAPSTTHSYFVDPVLETLLLNDSTEQLASAPVCVVYHQFPCRKGFFHAAAGRKLMMVHATTQYFHT